MVLGVLGPLAESRVTYAYPQTEVKDSGLELVGVLAGRNRRGAGRQK